MTFYLTLILNYAIGLNWIKLPSLSYNTLKFYEKAENESDNNELGWGSNFKCTQKE